METRKTAETKLQVHKPEHFEALIIKAHLETIHQNEQALSPLRPEELAEKIARDTNVETGN